MQAIFVSILQYKSSVANSFFDNRYYVLGVSTSFGYEFHIKSQKTKKSWNFVYILKQSKKSLHFDDFFDKILIW